MRIDQRYIINLIEPCSRVLDVGSGDGSLIKSLFHNRGCDAQGIEINMQAVARSVAHGMPVMQGDADQDLINYPSHSFDYVVLQKTLQAVDRPLEVLRQMVRIGQYAIVSFPNFGHWKTRFQLLRTGRMPNTKTWSTPWYITPNIHPCTILDFFDLCKQENIIIEKWFAFNDTGKKLPFDRHLKIANLLAEQAIFLLKHS